MQLALRNEDFSDYGSSTVGKLAIGMDIAPWLDFRASVSTAFRAPNIIQVNEKTVVRSRSYNSFFIHLNYVRCSKSS